MAVTADDPPVVTGDLDTDRRLDRLSRAKGRDPREVAAELVEFGLTNYEDALGEQ